LVFLNKLAEWVISSKENAAFYLRDFVAAKLTSLLAKGDSGKYPTKDFSRFNSPQLSNVSRLRQRSMDRRKMIPKSIAQNESKNTSSVDLTRAALNIFVYDAVEAKNKKYERIKGLNLYRALR